MKLGHAFCFTFPVHDSHGAVAPDALPTALIYEDHGGALAYTPTIAQIGALTGQYYCYGDATAANGFEVGKDYNIMATAVVAGATWNSRIAQFTIETNDIDNIATLIGTPVALDGAAATLGAMLTKLADDNGGADFDATTDSQTAIADAIVVVDGNVDDIETLLGTVDGKIDTIDGNVDDIETAIGTPVALDGGSADLAGMLVKMADDNGGMDFNSETDSLHEIAASIGGTPGSVWDALTEDHLNLGSFGLLMATWQRPTVIVQTKAKSERLRIPIADMFLEIIDNVTSIGGGQYGFKYTDNTGVTEHAPLIKDFAIASGYVEVVGGKAAESPYTLSFWARNNWYYWSATVAVITVTE